MKEHVQCSWLRRRLRPGVTAAVLQCWDHSADFGATERSQGGLGCTDDLGRTPARFQVEI